MSKKWELPVIKIERRTAMTEKRFNPHPDGKLSVEEFVILAIRSLRMGDFKGIHSVYSGFNEALKSISARTRSRRPINWLKKKRSKSGQSKAGFCFIYRAKLLPNREGIRPWKKWA